MKKAVISRLQSGLAKQSDGFQAEAGQCEESRRRAVRGQGRMVKNLTEGFGSQVTGPPVKGLGGKAVP